jgi:hypothetical protein
MKKVIRLTESDLMRIVKRVIKESDGEVKKTDAKTNQYWNQLKPRLKALGFNSKVDHIVNERSYFNIGGYPSVDFYSEVMTHPSGITITYPADKMDYTGDYYPNFVEINGSKNWNQSSHLPTFVDGSSPCIGSIIQSEPDSGKGFKVSCGDYIVKVVTKAINDTKK